MPPLAEIVSPSAIAHGIGQSLKLARAANSRGGASVAPFDGFAERLEIKNSRGDKTAIELFVAGVRHWEAGVRRRLDDGKSKAV
jgi:hypothetical protein